MRRLIVFFIIVCNFVISPQSLLGMSISCEDLESCAYLIPHNKYTFYRIEGGTSDWSFSVLNKYNKLVDVYTINNSMKFNVEIKEHDTNWNECKRFYTAHGDSCFYQGYIINHTHNDTLAIKLLLVPSKPLIQKIVLKYDSYDYLYHELVNPLLDLNIRSDNLTGIGVLKTESGNNKVDQDIYFVFGAYLDFTREDGQLSIKDLKCDVNQWLCFFANNPFGLSVNSDTILTNKLIKDDEILNDLNEVTKINTLSNELSTEHYRIENGALEITSNVVSKLYVCNINGQLIFCLTSPAKGLRYQLPKGISFLKLVVNNKIYSYKIQL